MAAQYYEGIGRRKAASARVRIHTGGTGNVMINDKDGVDYMPRSGDMEILLQPLELTGNRRNFDVTVHVNGGGISGRCDPVGSGPRPAATRPRPQAATA